MGIYLTELNKCIPPRDSHMIDGLDLDELKSKPVVSLVTDAIN